MKMKDEIDIFEVYKNRWTYYSCIKVSELLKFIMTDVVSYLRSRDKISRKMQSRILIELSKLIITASEEEKKAIQLFEDDIKGVTKAKEVERLARDTSDKAGKLEVECL
jgi:Holliday junction resolvasome RuvABC DNA-binding subunit